MLTILVILASLAGSTPLSGNLPRRTVLPERPGLRPACNRIHAEILKGFGRGRIRSTRFCASTVRQPPFPPLRSTSRLATDW